MMVVLLGPDGAGKSTAADRLAAEAASKFAEVHSYHLYPFRERDENFAAEEPHASTDRGFFLSTLKLIYLVLRYSGSYWFRLRAISQRGALIIFDRYYHDMLIDAQRYRYGGSNLLARWIGRLIPAPDLWLVFVAPPEILRSRKTEVSEDETRRQVEEYRRFADGEPNAVLIDASLPASEVFGQSWQAISRAAEAQS